MLNNEKIADKAQSKAGAKVVKFDLNEGIVGVSVTRASTAPRKGSAVDGEEFQMSSREERSDSMIQEAAKGELDEDIALIKRKTIAVKGD